MPVAGIRGEVGLEAVGEAQGHASIPGPDVPGGRDRGGRQNGGLDAPVAGVNIEFVESAGHVDAAVTARGDEATIESRALDRAISGVETHLALDARHAQMSVTRADVELRLARDFHHEVEGTPPDAEIP